MAEHAHITTPSRRPLPATPFNTGGRRSLATGLAALTLAVPALASAGLPAVEAAPNPDADLIRLCAEFDALEREYRGLDYDVVPCTPEDVVLDTAVDRILAAQRVVVDAIERHPPATLAGVAALARSILLEEAALHGADPHSTGGRLVWHIVETLAGDRA